MCDLVDNDCDSFTDEGVQTIYYRDADNDTYGNASVTTGACTLPGGYVSGTGDCNDTNGRLNPSTVWYYDGDSDRFATGSTQTSCTDPGAAWYLPSELVNTYTSGANLRSGLVGYRTFDGYNAIGENGVGGTGALCNNPAGGGSLSPASCDNTGPVFTGGKIEKSLYFNGS